jgi:hypothetical protein
VALFDGLWLEGGEGGFVCFVLVAAAVGEAAGDVTGSRSGDGEGDGDGDGDGDELSSDCLSTGVTFRRVCLVFFLGATVATQPWVVRRNR